MQQKKVWEKSIKIVVFSVIITENKLNIRRNVVVDQFSWKQPTI